MGIVGKEWALTVFRPGQFCQRIEKETGKKNELSVQKMKISSISKMFIFSHWIWKKGNFETNTLTCRMDKIKKGSTVYFQLLLVITVLRFVTLF